MNRKLGRNAYRRELVSEFDALFPTKLFQRIPQRGNTLWTPLKILCVSMIMFWLPGKTLNEQFSAARRLVKFIKPHWTLPDVARTLGNSDGVGGLALGGVIGHNSCFEFDSLLL